MFGWILDYITDKQVEGEIKREQEDLSVWFKDSLHFIVAITPGTEAVFNGLTVTEPIKLICDYKMPPFSEEEHLHKDPAVRKELREYHNFDFGIAVVREKTDSKLGYLPMPANVFSPDIYRRGTWKEAIHRLMHIETKIYAKLVHFARIDNPINSPSRFDRTTELYPNGFFQVGLFINTELEELNNNVMEWIQRQEMINKTANETHGARSTSLEENYESLDDTSIWDEYDEDGIPYEDHFQYVDNVEVFSKGRLDNDDTEQENYKEPFDSENVWDEYDEYGVPFSDKER